MPTNSFTVQKQKRPFTTATKIGCAAGLLIASQALFIAITTPRLPPPSNSGHDFDEDGLLLSHEEGYEENDAKEFRIVLIGDSPVEGIGNDSHDLALGGQTAKAFSKLLKRPVRYWSYGKSGLTARGVTDEMLPHLQRLSKRMRIDAVVVSCGVNNVLEGISSAASFGGELRELLCSIRLCCQAITKVLVLELIDFELLPFLPFPLSKLLSWRSKALQKEVENTVKDFNKTDDQMSHVGMAPLPKLEELLGGDREHPLLDHMSKDDKKTLSLNDFFADDNFHPKNNGTTIIGKIIVETYVKLIIE